MEGECEPHGQYREIGDGGSVDFRDEGCSFEDEIEECYEQYGKGYEDQVGEYVAGTADKVEFEHVRPRRGVVFR